MPNTEETDKSKSINNAIRKDKEKTMEKEGKKMKMNQNKTANLSTEEMKKEIINSIEKMNEESLESFYKFVITIKDFSKLQLEYLEKIADPGTMEFDDYMEAVEKVAKTTDEEIIRLMDDIN